VAVCLLLQPAPLHLAAGLGAIVATLAGKLRGCWARRGSEAALTATLSPAVSLSAHQLFARSLLATPFVVVTLLESTPNILIFNAFVEQ
jgi:hypothetical protein